MNKLNLWKMLSSALLASLALFLWLSPAGAIDGTDADDIPLKSSDGGAGPDIEISADGAYLAVAYYKQNSAIPGAGAVYLKSANLNDGWVSSTFLGLGSSPQVAFNRGVNNVVYVVWVNSSNTAIQSARCSLHSTTQPTCTTGNSVRTTGTGTLNYPDLVVDGSNVLHVAWLNGNIIEMARATAADSVTAWPSSPVTPGLCGGSKAEAPVLGWTSTSPRIHLAFLCGSASVPATSVEYRRSVDYDPFSADTSKSFAIIGYGATADDQAISSDHSKLNNLAMAAGSAQVSLVWDGLLKTSSTDFRLMSITSTDEGSNWPKNGTRWQASYVPSGADAYSSITDENKTSTTSTVPPQEYGLRPSLVISGTAGSAAVVWQQRRGDTCGFGESSSSDIYFAYPQTSVISDTLEHTDPIDYSIDPDLAVKSSDGTRHFVFMKDDHTDECVGGDKADYAINYRGPFKAQTYDYGEIGDGNVYLPIIKK